MNNNEPTDQAAGVETTPVLNLDGLHPQLEAIKARVPRTAKAYNGNADPLFADIAARHLDAWRNFEQTGCQSLVNASHEADSVLNGWPAERDNLLAAYRRDVGAANGELRDRITVAIREDVTAQRAAMEIAMTEDPNSRPHAVEGEVAEASVDEGPDDRTPDELHRDELQMQYEEEVVGATGRRNGHISDKNPMLALYVGIGFAVIYGLSEWLGGLGFFRAIGTRAEAAGLTALLVVGLSALADITAIKSALVVGYLSAMGAFKKHFPQGVDEYGNTVHVNTLDLHDLLISVTGLVILFGSTLGLVFWRTKMAATNPLLKNTEIAAWIIFGAVMVNFLVILFISPSVKKEVTEHINRLHEELLKANELLKGQMAADAEAHANDDDVPTEPIEAAKYHYRAAVAQAAGPVETHARVVGSYITDYQALRTQYRDARKNVLIPAFRDRVAELIHAVGILHPDFDQQQFSTPGQSARIGKMLTTACPLTLDNPELLAKIEAFTPNVQLPSDIAITEFQPLADDIRKKLVDEIEQAELAAAQRELKPLVGTMEEEEQDV